MEENRVSEWNEANFKMKRLHDIQEAINFFKLEPTQITEGKFHYEKHFKYLNALAGEGRSKYADTEKLKVDRIKLIITEMLAKLPPHSRIIVDNMNGSKNGFTLDKDRLKIILTLIDEYEDVIKEFNDKHGLSTKNSKRRGMF